MATTGVQTVDRRYIGERLDQGEELSYLNARYFDSKQGQFVSQDPVFWEVGLTPDGVRILRNPQIANSYGYAGDNPVVGKDPTGRQYVDANGSITSPYGVGGTAGYQYSSTADDVVYIGLTFSQPGPSGSVTYAPSGNPSDEWNASLSGNYRGITGQGSVDLNNNKSGAIGVGTRGAPSISFTKGIKVKKVLEFLLGGAVGNESTPMTTGPQPGGSNTTFSVPLNTGSRNQSGSRSGSSRSTNISNPTRQQSVSSYISAGYAALNNGDKAAALRAVANAQAALNLIKK
jgi:RHS repeat-associated protein